MQVILRNTSSVALIDSFGAELKSFKDGFGTEYMWQGNPQYWNKTSPILFPSVGNVRDNRCLIDGKEYNMPKHGFARDMEFKVCYQSEEKVIFSLISNEKTKEFYPFDFNLQVSYELDGCTINVRYDVFNMSDNKDMPYCIGAHPGFNIPVTNEDTFENYNICFEEIEDILSPVFDIENMQWNNDNRIKLMDNTNKLRLNYNLFDNEAIMFENTKSKRVDICSVLTGRGIRVKYEGFNMIAFWTKGKNSKFICVEPLCGTAIFSDEDNNFENKRGTQILKPNQKNTHKISITML